MNQNEFKTRISASLSLLYLVLVQHHQSFFHVILVHGDQSPSATKSKANNETTKAVTLVCSECMKVYI